MPKIPQSLVKLKEDKPRKPPCVACRGSGKSSNGFQCPICHGKGVPYTWYCPYCNARHDGIEFAICRNPKCPSKRLRSNK